MRTFAIGDIHGGLRALEQVLERASLKKDDKLIFLGDYVDGWSDSANVISFLMELDQQYSCIFVRGNHDDLLLDWLATDEMNEKWLQHGGKSSYNAYNDLSSEEIKKHVQFLEATPNFHVDKQNRLFLHAGFANMHGPDHEYNPYTVYWDRSLWEMALALDKSLKPDNYRYPKRLKLFNEIYIGHSPVTRIGKTKPVNLANLWNVDTGAAFKGRLSMLNIDSKELFQSDPVFELYPDEIGRN